MGWLTPSFFILDGTELSVREGLENVVKFVSTYLGFNPEDGDGSGPPFSPHVHGRPGCPLCSQKFIVGDEWAQVLKCQHKFHKACLDSFLCYTTVCPVCHVIKTHIPGEPVKPIPANAPAPDAAEVMQEFVKGWKDALTAFTLPSFPTYSTNKYEKVHTC